MPLVSGINLGSTFWVLTLVSRGWGNKLILQESPNLDYLSDTSESTNADIYTTSTSRLGLSTGSTLSARASIVSQSSLGEPLMSSELLSGFQTAPEPPVPTGGGLFAKLEACTSIHDFGPPLLL